MNLSLYKNKVAFVRADGFCAGQIAAELLSFSCNHQRIAIDDDIVQIGNNRAPIKQHPKKSWDIRQNRVFTFSFPQKRIKQVWIVGDELVQCESWSYCFSLAEIEIIDNRGRNVALASYGNGIIADSYYAGPAQEREAHHWYWPLHYDLGLKWSRIGYHDDPINWHWVEREKGVYSFDEEAEAAINLLVENGVEIIYCLGFGNRLYQKDPTHYSPFVWEFCQSLQRSNQIF